MDLLCNALWFYILTGSTTLEGIINSSPIAQGSFYDSVPVLHGISSKPSSCLEL